MSTPEQALAEARLRGVTDAQVAKAIAAVPTPPVAVVPRCPWCDSDETVVRPVYEPVSVKDSNSVHYGKLMTCCIRCGARGPTGYTNGDAIGKWSKRAFVFRATPSGFHDNEVDKHGEALAIEWEISRYNTQTKTRTHVLQGGFKVKQVADKLCDQLNQL